MYKVGQWVLVVSRLSALAIVRDAWDDGSYTVEISDGFCPMFYDAAESELVAA